MIKYSWFLFDVIYKSMVLKLVDAGELGMWSATNNAMGGQLTAVLYLLQRNPNCRANHAPSDSPKSS
jgi:hypothetical protein